jgi:hypothetical protein
MLERIHQPYLECTHVLSADLVSDHGIFMDTERLVNFWERLGRSLSAKAAGLSGHKCLAGYIVRDHASTEALIKMDEEQAILISPATKGGLPLGCTGGEGAG